MLRAAHKAVVDFQDGNPFPPGDVRRGDFIRAAIYRAMIKAALAVDPLAEKEKG